MKYMVQARGLTRHFKVKKDIVEAVRGIDLDVREGELVTFLGPNGAGKSTFIKMLTTLLPPTAGSASIVGYDVVNHPASVRQHIGYVGQGNGAGHNYRVRDELVIQGLCYGLSRAESNQRSDQLLEALDLQALAKRTVSTLSGGQMRRLDVAIGLVHRPSLLFLDEPSTGLDPHSRANLWEHILKLRQQYGITIFLTTHYLDEADAMAERVIVIDHGQIIADDTPTKLKDRLSGDNIIISTDKADELMPIASMFHQITGDQPDINHETLTINQRILNGTRVLPELLKKIDSANLTIQTVEIKRPTLDDVFLSLTGRSIREDNTVSQEVKE